MELKNDKRIKYTIYVLSVVIPAAVAALFGIKIQGVDLSFLPPIYATINGLTAVTLIAALFSIKKGNRTLHERLMKLSILFSILFLLGYVAYHMTSDPTIYGDLNGDKVLSIEEASQIKGTVMIYYSLLISHILLSVAVIPLVLFSYFFAWKGDFVKHKKWVNYAFPIWLYVAISGVVVFVMISSFY
jgi:putative membrane protein